MSKSDLSVGIQDFYNAAIAFNFARLHQFRIIQWQQFGRSMFTNKDGLYLYLESASLPAKEMSNIVVSYAGMNYNAPGMTSYNNTTFATTFRCDERYVLRKIFEDYMTSVHDDSEGTGERRAPGEDSYMEILLLDKDLLATETYKLIGTNVTNIGPIQYNTGDTGTIAKIDVNFTYQYWRRSKK